MIMLNIHSLYKNFKYVNPHTLPSKENKKKIMYCKFKKISVTK